MLRLAHSIEVAMKAIPFMGWCRIGGSCRRGEGSRDRWRWGLVTTLLLIVAVVFLLARCSFRRRLLAGLRLGLLTRFLGLPLRLNARDLLFANCFLWGIDYYLRGEARI